MADNYTDTGKMTEKQKVQEITEKLEQGMKELFQSETYKSYLNTMSKFYTYSFNNTMLIAMQKPDATLVAGYKAWQKNFDRHVKKGEKGIRILAPAPYKIKEEQEKTDPETGEIVLDKNGMPVIEEVEVKIPAFRVVSVFDVSQTDGKELPDIGVSELSGSVQDYEEFMQALTEVSPVPVSYEQIDGESKGYFHTSEHRIALQEGMSQSQTVKTAVHEVAHAKLHDRELNSELEETMQKDRRTKEVEAESIAYTVCHHFGIDTSDYSFGYIAGWSSGKDMKELKSSLDTIRKTASELITGISERLQELRKDRVEEQEMSAIQQAEIDRLPDGMVGLSEMHDYGYTWMEMLPLTRERAAELFGEDVTIYQLHEDGSETLVENTKDLQTHEGMFGVEKADWNAYLEHQSMNKELEESPANREAQFLHGSQNQFGIYQLNDSPQAKEVRFMNSDFFEMKGVAIARENYNLVYTAPLEEGMTLEDIYTKFNIDHPEDFTGHSLSVSDVVVLHQNGKNTSHFVDSFGYKEVPEFTQEMTEELQAEQTSVMEGVTEIHGEIAQESDTEASEHEEKAEIMENDKVSYYVIEDISTWADNSPEKSRLERFDSLSDAMEQFSQYRADIADDSDERARTTLGASVNGVEFDVAYAVRHENILSLDFTHSQTAQESGRFMEALQTLFIGLPIDKVRVHRDMTPEEKKDFVKRRFTYQLKQSGIDDDSFYMARFDALYEQGKMDNLMPTANQQHIVEDVPYTEWDNPYFHIDEPEQMAFSAGHRYISIQSCTDGYDYSVFNADYRLLDGGVYDNPNISIHAALKAVMEDFEVTGGELFPVDYEELMEKTEAAGQTEIQEKIQAKQIVSDFKAKTNEMFHEISGLNAEDMEMSALAYILSKIDEYDMDAEIVDVVVSGSRCRGLEQEGSDIDIVVEYKGSEKEDVLFDVLHEDGLKIGGVKLDINPITEGKTGTLAAYLPGVESYLEEKRTEMEKASAKAEKVQEKTVTLTVAECNEFHNLGEFHENIASVEEAIGIFQKIPPERMNGIPSIGIHIHTEGTETYEDVQMDIFSGGVADLEMLHYVPDITDEPKAVAMIQELIDKLPDIEVRGSLEKWQAAFLATEIDQLSYDYDPHQYKDTVEDREAQVANITEDIRSGNTEYLSDFLNAIIAEEVRESITDIFGQGTEPADSDAVQTARKAKELLDRLAEYKPLAKVEELEEQNYNMIDNVLNNGAERKETGQSKSRISVREKLAEKKAVIEKRDKAERDCLEKDTEKKVHREM